MNDKVCSMCHRSSLVQVTSEQFKDKVFCSNECIEKYRVAHTISVALTDSFAKTFSALFECRVNLRDSTISNKEKLRRIEKCLCDLDKGISSIFHIIKEYYREKDESMDRR